MKILFLSNAPMDAAWQKWEQGDYPGHRLFGATHLPKYGIDVDVLPHIKYMRLKEISDRIKVLGNLDQQLRILFRNSPYDLVYSGDDLNTSVLTLLRYIGLYKKPIAVVVHRAFKKNFWNKVYINLFMKGKDKFLCRSSVIRDNLRNEFSIPEEKLSVLELGVDLSFYESKKKGDARGQKDNPTFILSLGKTYRDYNTLVKAFSEIHYPLKIYCSADSAPTVDNIPSNVEVHYDPEHPKGSTVLSFEELIAEYEKAYAIAIPLDIPPERRDSVTLTGNMSLGEAMAMGKAVVMTRNKQFSVDIEKEGIGIYVEPEDIKGWQKAISYLLEHPQETKEMGTRARKLCESKYNLEYFSSRLAEELKSVVKEGSVQQTTHT
ncbi:MULTISPECIES: glycosyltransferase family 4 protein [unclassified Coleofasciculus]|uniref:glycosyltransferase family 4 protein n=1 Tax=unclassified Coleofasciculus TaxID=2692782 RepID=UPI001880B9D6|nr:MULTISPECIES: glycosyltransferase family 4 protein [unclassified Coleofasciculus]MBE9125335.1 glycosyltransferase family 4 protein [Coleofasciculus sp. LEGE 07081]MBE9148538.1 glycosyltransferase family 4 protein [Coleofasciculus sp. LEGE 07092]